ncbi:phosphatase PAP2 family protein [Tepidibacillus marianensis]|uniref:phosphatase PAP2 family protein n=1 Tax=Tepidibacillus marianensis TaxID=3131995 RepID=UPI0030CEDA5C
MEMNYKYLRRINGYIVLLFLLVFGLIAAYVSLNKIQWFDSPVIHYVQSFESPKITSIMEFFTWIGSTKVVISIIVLICILLFIFFKHRTELIFFVIVMLGSTLFNDGLKWLFHRQRPTLHRIIQEVGYSFPSGHSMAAFSLYATLSFLLWKHIRTQVGRGVMVLFAILMILAIGTSRIYLGVHYPSDVIGGYFASGVWFILCVTVYQWYLEKKFEQGL